MGASVNLNLDFLNNTLGQHRLGFFHVHGLLIPLLTFFKKTLHLQYFAVSFSFYLLCNTCEILMAQFFARFPDPMWFRILLNFLHLACGCLLYVFKWFVFVLKEDLLIILKVTVINYGVGVGY
jgi:hypothetical protein